MERNILADKLKGYACFLVLFGHVIMGIRLSGIYIPSVFEGMEKFIWSFHVALFLFLSGVVYKLTGEWRGKETKTKFILHKLLNLGVPYVTFSVIYILINSMVGAANTQSSVYDVLNIWKAPVAQYWYLYALFFLFCIWTLLSGILENYVITIFTVGIAYIVPLTGLSLGCFEVVFYSALAFGVGTFVDFSKLDKPSPAVKILIIALHIIVSVIFIKLDLTEAHFIKELLILFGIYASIMFISLIHNMKFVSDFLNFINKYSFQIYLLHTIFTAGIRIILIRLNVNGWVVHIVAGTLCGIVFSVLAAIIAKKTKFLNFFFFPSKILKGR